MILNNFRLDDQGRIIPVGNLKGMISTGGLVPGVPIWTGEASGNPAHFEDGSRNTIIQLDFPVDAIQEGSETPTPDNIRNIIGFSSAEIKVNDGQTPPQSENIYQIDFYENTNPINIYGAKIHIYYNNGVLSGTATFNMKLKNCDGSEDWRNYSTRYGFYLNDPDMKTLSGSPIAKSNWLKNSLGWNDNLSVHFGANNTFIYALQITNNILKITDVTTWKNYLSNNNLQLLYPCEEYTINLNQAHIPLIQTLLGINDVYSNRGAIDKIVYIRDWNKALNILWNAVFP